MRSVLIWFLVYILGGCLFIWFVSIPHRRGRSSAVPQAWPWLVTWLFWPLGFALFMMVVYRIVQQKLRRE